MIVGGYTINLYCDHPKHGKQTTFSDGTVHVEVSAAQWVYLCIEFVGHSERECKQQARESGWVFKRGRKVICPFCSKKRS